MSSPSTADNDGPTPLKQVVRDLNPEGGSLDPPEVFSYVDDLQVTIQSHQKSGKEVDLKASIATPDPSPVGEGGGLDLSQLAQRSSRGKAGVDLTLTYGKHGSGQRTDLKVTGSIWGQLTIGKNGTATTFRVYYDVKRAILVGGVSKKEGFGIGTLVRIFDQKASLNLPPTLPFSPTSAFIAAELKHEFLLAEIGSEIGNAFVALGPKGAFGGNGQARRDEGGREGAPAPESGTQKNGGGTKNGKETDYVCLLGAEFKAVQIDRLPLVNEKLTDLGLDPIKVDHLGVVAATAQKSGLRIDAGKIKNVIQSPQFDPPQSAPWSKLNPAKSVDFFEKLDVEEGVSLMGELSVESLSDVIVVPFYRPDEQRRHRHRKPPSTGGLDGPGEAGSPRARVEGEDVPVEVEDAPGGGPAASGGEASSSKSAVQWMLLDESLGVLDFHRIGAQVQDEGGAARLALLLDVSVQVAGLKATFYGLGARFKTETSSSDGGGVVEDFDPVLHGIQVGFKEGGIQIGAGLLRSTIQVKEEGGKKWKKIVAYTGDAVMRAESYGFSGIGSFSAGSLLGDPDNPPPSLFLFVFLDVPIGTPTIHVEQMAAGFGYNRAAEAPSISSLHKYPLFETMSSGEVDLHSYRKTFHYKAGNVWFGAGVTFSSWEMVNAGILPLLSAGTQTAIEILGTASIKIPKGQKPTPILISLALEATFSFNTGRLEFGGKLLEKTHIVLKDAEWKGGFGICTWLPTPLMSKSQRDKVGEYILTLGGYSPKVSAPSYYPQVPRLGYVVEVSKYVSIRGEVYAALTPSALMFGGTFAAVLHYGDFKASFRAKADVLMRWKPVHYEAEVTVNIKVSVTVHFFGTHTISGHISADLMLSGPPLHGTVTIDFHVLSTTVHFGSDESEPGALDWAHFKASFLKSGDGEAAIPATNGQSLSRSSFCTVQVGKGLAQQWPKNSNERQAASGDGASGAPAAQEKAQQRGWIVHPDTLRLSVEMQVPATEATLRSGSTSTSPGKSWTKTLGVAPTIPPDGQESDHEPIRSGDLEAALTVELKRVSNEGTATDALARRFNLELGTSKVPKSMWGDNPKEQSIGSDAQIDGALTSLHLEADVKKPDQTKSVPWANLVEQDEPRSYEPAAPPSERRSVGDRLTRATVAKHVTPDQVPKRKPMLDALHESGFHVSGDEIHVRALDQADKQGFLAGPRKMTWTTKGKT